MNYRPYTLQEAYDAFGYRSYTNVRYKGESTMNLAIRESPGLARYRT